MNQTLQKNQVGKIILEEIQRRVDSRLEFFQIFKNPKGTRFTITGYSIASKLWQTYVVKFPMDNKEKKITYKIKNRTYLMLDQRMTWPYYLSRNKLVLFNEMDAFEFSLYQGDINLWANKN